MEENNTEASSQSNGNGYGKRPLWYWIVLYLIIGAVIYGLIYYFVLSKPDGLY